MGSRLSEARYWRARLYASTLEYAAGRLPLSLSLSQRGRLPAANLMQTPITTFPELIDNLDTSCRTQGVYEITQICILALLVPTLYVRRQMYSFLTYLWRADSPVNVCAISDT